MMQHFATSASKQPIDRLTAAESIATILARLNVEKFPDEERLAVATAQIAAIDEWLAAYVESGGPKGMQQRLS